MTTNGSVIKCHHKHIIINCAKTSHAIEDESELVAAQLRYHRRIRASSRRWINENIPNVRENKLVKLKHVINTYMYVNVIFM